MHITTSEGVFEFYRYNPSIPACIIFICLFSTTTIFHFWQLFRTRAWILLPLVLGGLSEILGYIARILSAKQKPNYSIGLYVLQSSPTLLAATLFAATIYMCLGRIIRATNGERFSLIPLRWLTKFFVAGDVVGLGVQGAGAVVMPLGTLQDYHTGSNIVIAGLALLVFTFSLFLVVTLLYDIRRRRHLSSISFSSFATSSKFNPSRHLLTLYITSTLIFIRSIYRLTEYVQGNDGWLMRNEWSLYVFDASLMWGVMVLFNVWHPGRVKEFLNGRGGGDEDEDAMREGMEMG